MTTAETEEDRLKLALRALGDVIEQRRKLDRLELARIKRARSARASWEQIARVYGYRDRRGAHMRFRALLGSDADSGHAR